MYFQKRNCLSLPFLGISLFAFLIGGSHGFSATLLVESESFSTPGGWVVDQQSMDQMGSPYAMAHGLGRPVADAVTTVETPEAGNYRIWGVGGRLALAGWWDGHAASRCSGAAAA